MRAPLLVFLLMCGELTQPARALESDLPPAGRSRFDQLIGNAPVPYPFPRLVRGINAQMRQERGGIPPLKITLIPLGRSLQRNAGAPDFFRFPRVVAAADGPNLPGVPPLKDRLFLGFHEKGQVVEVISYNDAAARFEFQVVRNYRAGSTPQVTYARRSLCLACHQNAAPIFSRPLWDETPANPAIAARLRAARGNFYGVKMTGTDVAYFIDTAAGRANLFSIWQTLWQQGCGEDDAGDRCRMDAFSAALAYARNGSLPTADALPALDRNWKTRWPQGLPIPNPNLPNRDPLAALQDPANDPLLPRPPLVTWQAPDKTAFVVGLAGMLDAAAVRQLGRRDVGAALTHLRARGEFGGGPFSQKLLHDLLAELGLPQGKTLPDRFPPLRTEPYSRDIGTHTLFYAHCATCHDTTLAHPPNFLHGSPAGVEANLNQCAARIFVRLSMAGVAETNRSVSPMPPAAALANLGIDPHQWAHSPALATLKQNVAARLRTASPASLLQQPYDSLPPCLPQPAYAEHAP